MRRWLPILSGLCLLMLTRCQVTPSSPQESTPINVPETAIFPFGQIQQINSKILSEERTLNIWLPDGYHPDSNATYPIIYVLDGSANEDFPHIAGLVQFLNMYAIVPPSIVVGIANVDRKRDFTHPTQSEEDLKAIPTGGGSSKFINFLGNEVQPFIQETYKSNGYRTLIGQSLGGLLASEILMTKPELFEDYIIVSPSLWWDNESLVQKAADFFKVQPNLDKKVYLSMGTEHPVMHKVMDQFIAAMKEHTQPPFQWFYHPFPEEDHATILHRAVYKGLEVLNVKEEEKKH